MIKFYKLILIILSFINILKVKLKKINCANYFIINDNLKIIDQRSLNYFDIKTCKHTFNLIRTHKINFKIFVHILKIPNFFCYSIFKNLRINNKNNIFLTKLISKIFIFLKIKKILLIDDIREMFFFSSLSIKLNLNSLIYMHGKFSKNSIIHQSTKFNLYLVWSSFFKRQLLKANSLYKAQNIAVIGNPNLKKQIFLKKKKIKIKKCLILDEDFLTYDDIKLFLLKISKINTVKFFFKKKITRDIPEAIQLFCKKNNIMIIKEHIKLEQIINKLKIDSLMASSSTGLLEAIYYGLVPIRFISNDKNKENEFKIFTKQKLVNEVKNPKMLINILNKNYKYKLRLKNKQILWGDSIFSKKNVKEKILNFILK